MKTFWMTFAFFALGMISGILLWEKIDVKTIFKGTVKLRQRGRGNTQLTDIRPQIDANVEGKKQQRKNRRDERRAKAKADS